MSAYVKLTKGRQDPESRAGASIQGLAFEGPQVLAVRPAASAAALVAARSLEAAAAAGSFALHELPQQSAPNSHL